SPGKLPASLKPGQTGCLAPKTTFATREGITAVGDAGRRVTITTAPGGPRAILAARPRVSTRTAGGGPRATPPDGFERRERSRYLTLTNLTIQALDSSPTRAV